MKRKTRLILLMIFFALAAFGCNQRFAAHSLNAAAPVAQVTPAPPVEDQSEIGSTNGVMIMGILIVAIVSLPVLLRRDKK